MANLINALDLELSDVKNALLRDEEETDDGIYGWTTLSNLDPQGNVIQLEFPPLPVSNERGALARERAKRRSYKDKIGQSKIDTLMLDRKTSKTGQLEFCDSILITSNLNKWLQAINNNLEDLGMVRDVKYIPGGIQDTWRQNNNNILTIHSYEARNKIMVQPGQHKEDNLILIWVPIFCKLRAELHTVSTTNIGATPVPDEDGSTPNMDATPDPNEDGPTPNMDATPVPDEDGSTPNMGATPVPDEDVSTPDVDATPDPDEGCSTLDFDAVVAYGGDESDESDHINFSRSSWNPNSDTGDCPITDYGNTLTMTAAKHDSPAPADREKRTSVDATSEVDSDSEFTCVYSDEDIEQTTVMKRYTPTKSQRRISFCPRKLTVRYTPTPQTKAKTIHDVMSPKQLESIVLGIQSEVISLAKHAQQISSLRDEIQREKTLLKQERTLLVAQNDEWRTSIENAFRDKISEIQTSNTRMKTSITDQLKSLRSDIVKVKHNTGSEIHNETEKQTVSRSDDNQTACIGPHTTPKEEDTTDKIRTIITERDQPTHSQQGLLASRPNIVVGSELALNGSTFQARCANVNNVKEARQLQSRMLNNDDLLDATHNVLVYRIRSANDKVIEKVDDDGERGAGRRIMKILQDNNIYNILLITSRWYGGIHLNDERWPLYEQVTVDALHSADYIDSNITSDTTDTNIGTNQGVGKKQQPNESKWSGWSRSTNTHTNTRRSLQSVNERPTLIMFDSTCKNKHGEIHRRLIPGTAVSLAKTYNLEEVTRKLLEPKGPRDNIVIVSGINDLQKDSLDQFKDKLDTVVQMGRASYPKARLFLATLLPNADLEIDEANSYMNYLASDNSGIYVINTHDAIRSWHMTPNGIHPNAEGIRIIETCIRDAILPRRYQKAILPRKSNLNGKSVQSRPTNTPPMPVNHTQPRPTTAPPISDNHTRTEIRQIPPNPYVTECEAVLPVTRQSPIQGNGTILSRPLVEPSNNPYTPPVNIYGSSPQYYSQPVNSCGQQLRWQNNGNIDTQGQNLSMNNNISQFQYHSVNSMHNGKWLPEGGYYPTAVV
jgi:hypothetical protein